MGEEDRESKVERMTDGVRERERERWGLFIFLLSLKLEEYASERQIECMTPKSLQRKHPDMLLLSSAVTHTHTHSHAQPQKHTYTHSHKHMQT